MKLFKENPNFIAHFTKKLFFTLSLFFSFTCITSNAEDIYKLNEVERNDFSENGFENNDNILSNPFEIVEMIRRSNSMYDATIPSDAIDDALKSFNMKKDNKKK